MKRVKGYSLAALSAISYGMIPLFVIPIKRTDFSMNTTLFYRFFISALFLAGIMLYKRESFKIGKREWLIFALLGLFYSGGSDLLFVSYDLLTPGIASTLFFVYPVFVVLLMYFIFKEKIHPLTIAALVITVVGIYILSVRGEGFHFTFFGLFVALSSALCCAMYMVTLNKTQLKGSGWRITFWAMMANSAYFLIKTMIYRDSLALPDIDTLFNFTTFAFVTTVISMTTLTYAIQLIGSTPTSILGALEPVVAVGISVYVFSAEDLTTSLVAGVLFILIGVIINVVADEKKEKSLLSAKAKPTNS